jgi:hypothetical protein
MLMSLSALTTGCGRAETGDTSEAESAADVRAARERFACVSDATVQSGCRLADARPVADAAGIVADVTIEYDFTCKPGGIPSSIYVYDELNERNGFHLSYETASGRHVIKTSAPIRIRDDDPAGTAAERFELESCSLKIVATATPSMEQVEEWARASRDLVQMMSLARRNYGYRRTVERFRLAFIENPGDERATIEEEIEFLRGEAQASGDPTYGTKADLLQHIINSDDSRVIFAGYEQFRGEVETLKGRADKFVAMLKKWRQVVSAELASQVELAKAALDEAVVPH